MALPDEPSWMLLVEMLSVLMLMHHRFLTPSYACGQLAPVVAVLHSSKIGKQHTSVELDAELSLHSIVVV